jgi:DNA ligase (NAD+)
VLEVRGEVYMSRDRFRALQRTPARWARSWPGESAQRRGRQHPPARSGDGGQRPLSFFAYGLGETRAGICRRRIPRARCALGAFGVPVCGGSCGVAQGAEGLVAFHARDAAGATALPFDIDGVVYKVNSLELQQRSASSRASHAGPWRTSIRRRSDADRPSRPSTSRSDAPGRSRRWRAGAGFRRRRDGDQRHAAQRDEARRKDVRVGDTVIVRRAGDVIPEVVGGALRSRRSGPPGERHSSCFEQPKACPVCGSAIEREEDEADARCSGGLICPAQRKQALLHFAGRRAMDIEGARRQTGRATRRQRLVKTPADLYKLGMLALANLERMAEKSAAKSAGGDRQEQVRRRCRASFSRSASAMSARRRRRIWRAFRQLDRLMAGRRGACSRCPTSVRSWRQRRALLREPHNREVIAQLRAAGVTGRGRAAPRVVSSRSRARPSSSPVRCRPDARRSRKHMIEALGRQGRRLRVEEDGLRGGRRRGRLQARQGAGAGRYRSWTRSGLLALLDQATPSTTE